MPTTPPQRTPKKPATKLKAQAKTAGYIDSCFSYYPYEFCGDKGSGVGEAAPAPSLISGSVHQSAASAIPNTAATPNANKKHSLQPEEMSGPVFSYKGGHTVGPQDAKTRKPRESSEFLNVVLSPENEGSIIEPRNPGRLVSRKERRFLWPSLEHYKTNKRAREAREGSTSSLYSIVEGREREKDSEIPQKRIKHSPATDRYYGWTPINSEHPEKSRTRRVRFAEAIRKIRASSSSSELSRHLPTKSGQTLGDRHDHNQTIIKERSRSPPRDRNESESSEESRYHRDERHSVEQILDAPAGVSQATYEVTAKDTGRERRDSGYESYDPEGRIPSHLEQHPEHIPRLTYLDSINCKLGPHTKKTAMLEVDKKCTKTRTAKDPKHSIAKIIITPPSSEACNISLKSESPTDESSMLEADNDTKTKAANDTKHSISKIIKMPPSPDVGIVSLKLECPTDESSMLETHNDRYAKTEAVTDPTHSIVKIVKAPSCSDRDKVSLKTFCTAFNSQVFQETKTDTR